jgi:hypothetical protein
MNNFQFFDYMCDILMTINRPPDNQKYYNK